MPARSDTVENRALPHTLPTERSPDVSVGVIIEHHVRPGSRDAVRAIWEGSRSAVSGAPDNAAR
jgi:hypothetical protein